MTRWIVPLLALATAGCLGDGGGSTVQGTPLGTEEGRSQNETGFGTGTSEGSSAAGQDLYGVCLDVCSEEADMDYCVEVVCAEFEGGGGQNGPGGPDVPQPSPGGVDYCAELSASERAALETLGGACLDCYCSTPPTSLQSECASACGI